MEIYVMNDKFDMICVLDTFISFIWTDRYCGYGDFELYTKAGSGILESVKNGYYLFNRDSEHVMVVESIELETDIEEGDNVKITGRSLESILDRRIVWPSAVISGNLQDCIKKLINDSFISPSIAERRIENFIFRDSSDKNVTRLTVEETEYNGDSIYDVIAGLCQGNGIGFKITFDDSLRFVFSLYAGADRSYSQSENPYVTFSPEFDNLINSNYIESKQEYKNVVLVAGEKDESSKAVTAPAGSASGLERREMYIEASDISHKRDEGPDLNDAEYKKLLVQRGLETLNEYGIAKAFDGEFDASQLYTYNEDFFMGDIVQVSNKYGITAKARITEFIHSQDTSGLSVYPAFSILE